MLREPIVIAHGCHVGWVRPEELEVAEWWGLDMAHYGHHVACWTFSMGDGKAWEHMEQQYNVNQSVFYKVSLINAEDGLGDTREWKEETRSFIY